METSDYKYSIDGVLLSFIIIFMGKYLKTYPKEGETYYITKKELGLLIAYLIFNKNEIANHTYFDFVLDRLVNMEMLMKKNEKVKLKFW